MSIVKIEGEAYFFLSDDLAWLGVDVRHIDRDDFTQLWLWVRVPAPVVPGSAYQYFQTSKLPSGRECDSQKTRKISHTDGRFHIQTELDDLSLPGKVWIRIDLPQGSVDMDCLLLNTAHIPVSGWA